MANVDRFNIVNTSYDLVVNMSNVTFGPYFVSPFSVLFYRYMFILIYSVILVMCIFGNILVLIVTTKSARMKTRTNFFLANLAAADLCVGIICVLPNLLTFLYPVWLLGTAMCKIYYFTESFSFCASVLLLAAIALERYIAVMHPLKAKGLFTTCRMHFAQILIWVFAAVYNIPIMFFFDSFTTPDGSAMFCLPLPDVINMRIYYTINFALWYVFPLVTMCVVYTIISWTLWHSGSIFSRKNNDTVSNGSSTKMTPVPPEHCSSNVSSSSCSGDSGRGGDGGSRASGGSRGSSGNYNGNIYDANPAYCTCSSTGEVSDRFLLNGDDVCKRCGGDTSYTPVPKNGMSGPTQPTIHTNEEGQPIYWSWPSGSEKMRAEQNRQSHRSHLATRQALQHNTTGNTFEMACLNSNCIHYQRTHPKRKSAVNQNVTVINPKRRPSRRSFHSEYASEPSSPGQTPTYDSSRYGHRNTSMRVLTSRRKVVRLLVVVLLTFALCVLPHHVRLLMVHWDVYPASSFGMAFFPPLAFICMYLNSALNPVLYSLFSESFRHSLKELVRRPWQKWRSFISRGGIQRRNP